MVNPKLFNDLEGFWAIFLKPGLSENEVRRAGNIGNSESVLVERVTVSDGKGDTMGNGEDVGIVDCSKVDWSVEQERSHEIAADEFINKFLHC